MFKKDSLLKGGGGLSDVRMCMHARQGRQMHTHAYGTAKETEQKLHKEMILTAPKSSQKLLQLF
ncbi:MAG: hypothetical protein LH615_07530 [Ferruginibacter sp.]|nr:hypothetical protein [Ferruginibacter sp.]